jgi:hypothetical protein
MLKRLAVLTAGAVGLGATGVSAATLTGQPEAPRTTTLRLYGAGWQVHSNTQPRGVKPNRGDRVTSYGELRSAEGEKVGDFFGSIVSLRSPFAAGLSGDASLEIHSFVLNEGSLFGLGNTVPNGQAEDTFAIVGGTGRYAGARGIYVTRQAARGLGGDGSADFTFHLSA